LTILDRNSGTFNTTTSVTVTRSAGNYGTGTTIVVAIVGNTVFNTPGSATQRTSSVVNMGLYSYDIAGAGQASIAFTATAAGSGEWYAWELSAGSTWDTGSATQNNTGPASFAVSVTPTAGDRHILTAVGALGGSGNVRSVTGYSNSFTLFGAAQVTAQDYPFAAGADLDVTADGVTATSTTATFSAAVPITAGGIILAYTKPSGSAAVVPLNLGQRRRLLAGPRQLRGGARTATPVRAQVNPPFPVAGIKQPRRLRGQLARRSKSVAPVPPQVVVAPPTFTPASVRARLRFVRIFRGRSATPVPAQVAVVPPSYTPQAVRPRLRWLRPLRSRQATPVAVQAAAVPGPRLRPRGMFPRRGHAATPVPPQTAVAPPAYPPQGLRTRIRGLKLFRGRRAAPVPPQVVVAPPSYAPQPARARRAAALSRRGRQATPVGPYVAPAVSPAGEGPRIRTSTRVKALITSTWDRLLRTDTRED